MARWAGEGNDWIKLMAQKNREEAGRQRNRGTCSLLELERLGIQRRLHNDCGLDLWSRQTENKGMYRREVSEPSASLWGPEVHLRQRTADWDTHVFREHNKEANLWADKGAKGRVDESVDTARVIWSEVVGLCGFWLVSYLQEMWASFGSKVPGS